ncbi:MAG TPA: hypothetical protein VHC44_03715 [Verrucomicrobiae bacterium]|nr:hypothetical protein [Verrucomicrobiae bacterium]
MEEPKKSFWGRIWGRPIRSFALLVVLALLGFFVAGFIDAHGRHHEDFRLECIMLFSLGLFLLALPGLILAAIPRTRPWMSWVLRRWFFCTAVLVTVIALFYAEENWRGQRAWEQRNRELQAKGIVLDWDKFIPPAVPDDQNVFKAPKMQEWFVTRTEVTNGLRRISSNELTSLLQSPTNFPVWGEKRTIDTETEARAYLNWSDQLQPQFNLIHEALKRPYSQMEGSYSQPFEIPIPNFIVIRSLARVLAQRSHCYLILREPDQAVAELAFMHDLSHFLDAKPTGQPMTLVAAMINVAVVGVHAEAAGKGLQAHAWQQAQLLELQRQFSDVHTMIPVAAAFHAEPAASTHAMQTISMKEISNAFGSEANLFRVAPRGWILQNIANEAPFFFAPADAFDIERNIVSPRIYKDYAKRLETFRSHRSLFNILAALMIPNFSKAVQTTARNQNAANLAVVACGLERYRLAKGSYPASLDMLEANFVTKLPHDIINGGPLQYHRDGDSYVLYSIGWNEKDDGGVADPQNSDNGDWVWNYAAK